MRRVNRRRSGPPTPKRDRHLVLVDDLADGCDCPACATGDFDPQQAIDDLISDAVVVLEADDPLDVETNLATLLAVGDFATEEFDALLNGLLPQFEARANPAALALLLAVGSIAPGEVAGAARAAAGRLVTSGVAGPQWAAEIAEPMTVGDCTHLYDTGRTASVLACAFRRAGRGHAFVMTLNHLDCSAAEEIFLVDEPNLAEMLDHIRATGAENGAELQSEVLAPAEFRWRMENAMEARAVHDQENPDFVLDELLPDDDVPSYPAMAYLLRARLALLPAPGKPPAPHAQPLTKAPFQLLRQLAPEPRPALPPKRRTTAIYQLKVALRGAKPPIWRRLEVPANVSLARLHAIIQAAFGWEDSHLHVFNTPYGEFGTPDPELGHRSEKPVSLEQVAPEAGSRFRYLYDFGDDWDHDILVEKIVDRDPAAKYPRCTGGKRAAPPDDCGGIWGYLALVDILGDPTHPEHRERLDWLGLDDATEFDPVRFDVEATNRALSPLR